MFGEDSVCEWVDFNLPSALHSRSFKPKIEPPYSGKQTPKRQAHLYPPTIEYVTSLLREHLA